MAVVSKKPEQVAISAAQERGHSTLDAIQYLRGVAALLIVVFHVFPQISRMGYMGSKPLALSAGVDVFFIISGFVMVYSAARNPKRGALAFLRDRLVRIVPLYWALSLVMLAVLLFVPAVAQTSRLDWAHTIASFLFIAWMHPVQHLYYPMLVPGWSLNYEMFFYSIFAVGLALLKARRGMLVAITCSALIAITFLPAVVALPEPLDFYTRSLILEFGYGMLLAEAFLRRQATTSALWWLAIIAGAVGITFSTGAMQFVPQAFAVGLPALLVVLGTLYVPLRLKGWRERIAREMGDASYSIYLSHFMTMSALGQIWHKLVPDGPIGWIGFALFAVVGCSIFGILIYRLLERPLTRAVRSLVHSAPAEPSKIVPRVA